MAIRAELCRLDCTYKKRATLGLPFSDHPALCLEIVTGSDTNSARGLDVGLGV
jgi:hypothetical protein